MLWSADVRSNIKSFKLVTVLCCAGFDASSGLTVTCLTVTCEVLESSHALLLLSLD